MAYGKIKADAITYDNSGSDVEKTIASLATPDEGNVIKSTGEKCKISIRNIRREANDELKKLLKSKEISEDDEKKSEKNIQNITDSNIKLIEEKVISKEKEIMTI